MNDFKKVIDECLHKVARLIVHYRYKTKAYVVCVKTTCPVTKKKKIDFAFFTAHQEPVLAMDHVDEIKAREAGELLAHKLGVINNDNQNY